jgi:hypothetical protein
LVTNVTEQQTALSRRVREEPELQQLGAMQKKLWGKKLGGFLQPVLSDINV